MNIRRASPADCSRIVEIHLGSFREFFLSTLGRRFLKTYYNACLHSREAVTVVSVDDEGMVTGFAAGCLKSAGFHKRLLINNLVSFSWAALRIVFTDTRALKRLALNLTKKADINDNGDYAELLSIAVMIGLQGSGVGKELLSAFEDELRKTGVKTVSLTTDYSDNKKAIGFYQSAGYGVFYEFITYPERRMFRMIKTL